MSQLEAASKKVLGPLSNDVSLWLGTDDQQLITKWAIKTAMVFESTTETQRKRCYAKPEREALRLRSAFPAYTKTWIGRYSATGLLAFGRDFEANNQEVPKTYDGCIVVLLLNHLVIQTMTCNIPAEYQDRTFRFKTEPGPWNESLIQVWPLEGVKMWPPRLSFSTSGELPITRLIERVKMGTR